jgi:hypothetical protein
MLSNSVEYSSIDNEEKFTRIHVRQQEYRVCISIYNAEGEAM